MGQSGSQGRVLSEVLNRPNVHPMVFPGFLDDLPDELLLVILSFLPPRDLVLRCRLVSRRWRQLVDSASLWKRKCERTHRRDLLRASALCPSFSWQRVFVMDPFSRNLLRNPCATEGLQHWDVSQGGDGWRVEENRSHLEGADVQTCFVTSFLWCRKTQEIDLLKEGLWTHYLDDHQPHILVSDWFGAREDCGCMYEIKVELLAADRLRVITEFTHSPDPINQWNNQSYHQVSHVFQNYGAGVRFIRFSHSGKDTHFWKGWYGARITNSSVCVKCDTNEAQSGACRRTT
ncbi:F-box only protein 27 [Pelodytes ibericus]